MARRSTKRHITPADAKTMIDEAIAAPGIMRGVKSVFGCVPKEMPAAFYNGGCTALMSIGAIQAASDLPSVIRKAARDSGRDAHVAGSAAKAVSDSCQDATHVLAVAWAMRYLDAVKAEER